MEADVSLGDKKIADNVINILKSWLNTFRAEWFYDNFGAVNCYFGVNPHKWTNSLDWTVPAYQAVLSAAKFQTFETVAVRGGNKCKLGIYGIEL